MSGGWLSKRLVLGNLEGAGGDECVQSEIGRLYSGGLKNDGVGGRGVR